MKKITIVTGLNKSIYDQYAKKTLESWKKYFPSNIEFLFFTEDILPIYFGTQFLYENIQPLIDFQNKNRGRLEASGKKPTLGWKEKEIQNNYSFRFDVMKFSKQVMYTWAAYQHCHMYTDYMIWLDADVMALENITYDFLMSVAPKNDEAVSYLGRENKHSEIGFLMFNTSKADRLIDEYARPIIDNNVFDETEWHSAFLFDLARTKTKLKCHNLTPNGHGHVWFQSSLGSVMDHMKGEKRKKRMKSYDKR